uniref:Uncharacterized protein n=1 Tax=Utricularia reniformis TaxID=192314 RepID=A0A1Y0B1E8_9LAMI|nr:hypothetical protein AEK19_MT1052 [Utricularia reniformis]ART31275.1 hypothetical protein AEK19_MT1052 [Utricularia reniformis]
MLSPSTIRSFLNSPMTAIIKSFFLVSGGVFYSWQSFKQRGWAVHFIDLTSLYLRC